MSRPPPRRRSLAAPIAVGAIALAAIGTGAALTLSVGPEFDRLQASCFSRCAPATWSDLETRADIGYALMGVGAAAAVVDAVLWGFAMRRPRPERAVWILPVGSGVVLGGIF